MLKIEIHRAPVELRKTLIVKSSVFLY